LGCCALGGFGETWRTSAKARFPDSYSAQARAIRLFAFCVFYLQSLLTCAASVPNCSGDEPETGSQELLTVDLSEDERKYIWQAMYQWQWSASRQPFSYQVLGLSSWAEFANLTHRLAHAVTDREQLSDLDWMRILYLTECSWASNIVGSGLDFSIVTEFSDIDCLSLLRHLQRKIGRVARAEVLFPDGGHRAVE
jgi:hypothetical protein